LQIVLIVAIERLPCVLQAVTGHLQSRIIPQYVSDFQPRTMILLPGTRHILPTGVPRRFIVNITLRLCKIMSKDVGEYNTCPHLCHCCYASANNAAAMENWEGHCKCPHADTIAG